MSALARRLPLPPAGGVLTALDAGTTEARCLVARADDGGALEVIGLARRRADGMRAGAVVDREAAAACLAEVVAEAEESAGAGGEDAVFASFPGGEPESLVRRCDVAVDPGRAVGDEAVRRVVEEAARIESALIRERPDRVLLHAVPLSFSVDGRDGVRDPRGLFADRLALQLGLVAADRNVHASFAAAMEPALEGRRLQVVAAPWASALSVLDAAERAQGALVVDMGGSLTGVALVRGGRLEALASARAGGDDSTREAARRLSLPTAEAERAKILFGSAEPPPGPGEDDGRVVPVARLGAPGAAPREPVPRAALNAAVRGGALSALARVRAALDAMPGLDPGLHVALTGGASCLPGMAALAAEALGRRTRAAAPAPAAGLPDHGSGPAFASALGALAWALEQGAGARVPPPAARPGAPGLAAVLAAPAARALRRLGLEF